MFGFASAEAALDAALEVARHADRPEPLPAPDRRRAPRARGVRAPGRRPRRDHRQRARGGPRAERAASPTSAAGRAARRSRCRRPTRSWRRVADAHVARGSGAAPVAADRHPPDRCRQGAAGGGGGPARGRARSGPPSTWRPASSTPPWRPSRPAAWSASSTRVREALGAARRDLRRRARSGRRPSPGLDVWGDVGPAIESMRRLKRELDPAGVLNPGPLRGRHLGGDRAAPVTPPAPTPRTRPAAARRLRRPRAAGLGGHPRLRALRHLPAPVPDVPGARPGDGLARAAAST